MAKVFSIEKFTEDCKNNKMTDEEIQFAIRIWAKECEGLTETEMRDKHCCGTLDEWMVEEV
jgi:hypothetical protein